jgi:hypothetical protein
MCCERDYACDKEASTQGTSQQLQCCRDYDGVPRCMLAVCFLIARS